MKLDNEMVRRHGADMNPARRRFSFNLTIATRLLAGTFALLLAASSATAAQFVLFDVTFPFTKEDAENSKPSKSHYYVKAPVINPERPKDWTAPVDYRNGTVHVRLEVLEKPPGGEATTWSVCYIPNKGQKGGYGCIGTDTYKEKGVYEKDISMKAFWQNDGIVWEEGVKQMDLVMKDSSGGSGHAHKRADHEKFFPTKIRMTLIQVSAGAKYDPSLVPNLAAPKKKADASTDAVKPLQLAEFISKPGGVDASEACCGSETARTE
ncbi:MAG TPA: hypothetical protein VK968_09350 [Roseimicrobium sp.]|nr:hypothetical protein [Roseimicrobium sp.]